MTRPSPTEECDECGVDVDRGACGCDGCMDHNYGVPEVGRMYHCRCGRWWFYMSPPEVITIAVDKVDPSAREQDGGEDL